LRDAGADSKGTVPSVRSLVKIDGLTYELEVGSQGAMQNAVRLRIPSGDPNKVMKALEDFSARAQVGANHRPSKADDERHIKARIASKMDPAAFSATGGNPDKAVALFNKLAAKNPEMLEWLKGAEIKEVFPGQHAPVIPGMGKALKKSVAALSHTSDKDPEVILSMLSEKGLLGSVARFERGIFIEGMSTPDDFPSGGADGFFVRAQRGPLVGQVLGRFTLDIDPEQLERGDWWAFDFDNFGRSDSVNAKNRMGFKDIANGKKDLPGSNEIMFQKGVPPSAVRRITCSGDKDRNEILLRLRNSGQTHINGTPIDEFFIVGGWGSKR
jgi:hypothetical protein